MKTLRQLWEHSEKVTAWAALIVALIALGTSVKSCRQADRTQALAEEEFVSKRLVILRGIIEKDSDMMKLSPLDANIAIQRAEVIFPPQADAASRIISAPEYAVSLLGLRNSLQQTLEKLIPKEKDQAKVGVNQGVPIVINTNYVTQGSSFTDRSLYYIEFDYVVNDKPYELPAVSFNGLIFAGRLSSTDDPKKLLKEQWDTLTAKGK